MYPAGEEAKCVGSFKISVVRWTRAHSNGEGEGDCWVPAPFNPNLKHTDFIDTILSNFTLRPKSAAEIGRWLIRTLELKKKKSD